MADNIQIKNALQDTINMRTTESGNKHTPHNRISDGANDVAVDATTKGLKTYDVSNAYVMGTLSTTSDVVLGTTGALGDKLTSLYFPTAITEDLVIKDDTVEVFTIPSGAISAGYKLDLNVVSLVGAWSVKQTISETGGFVAIGRFV